MKDVSALLLGFSKAMKRGSFQHAPAEPRQRPARRLCDIGTEALKETNRLRSMQL